MIEAVASGFFILSSFCFFVDTLLLLTRRPGIESIVHKGGRKNRHPKSCKLCRVCNNWRNSNFPKENQNWRQKSNGIECAWMANVDNRFFYFHLRVINELDSIFFRIFRQILNNLIFLLFDFPVVFVCYFIKSLRQLQCWLFILLRRS